MLTVALTLSAVMGAPQAPAPPAPEMVRALASREQECPGELLSQRCLSDIPAFRVHR